MHKTNKNPVIKDYAYAMTMRSNFHRNVQKYSGWSVNEVFTSRSINEHFPEVFLCSCNELLFG